MKGQATYSFVPAGSKKEAVLLRAMLTSYCCCCHCCHHHYHHCKKSCCQIPHPRKKLLLSPPFQYLTITYHWQNLTDRKVRKKCSFETCNFHSPEDGIDSQVGDRDMSQHSPPLELLSIHTTHI